jgi:hypothetical protein
MYLHVRTQNKVSTLGMIMKMFKVTTILWEQGSLVITVTGLWDWWPRNLVWFPAYARVFPFLHNFHVVSGAHPAAHLVAPRVCLSPGVKWLQHETGHLSPSSVRVTPPCAFYDVEHTRSTLPFVHWISRQCSFEAGLVVNTCAWCNKSSIHIFHLSIAHKNFTQVECCPWMHCSHDAWLVAGEAVELPQCCQLVLFRWHWICQPFVPLVSTWIFYI